MGKVTLTVIRELPRTIVEQRARDSANIHYLDGRCLYGEQDHAHLPLLDRLHPDAETDHHIGDRFALLLQRKWRL